MWQNKIGPTDLYYHSFMDFGGDVVLMKYSVTFDTLSVSKLGSQNGKEVWNTDLVRPTGKANKRGYGTCDHSGNIYILESLYVDGDSFGSTRVYKLNSFGKLQWIKHLDSTLLYDLLYVNHLGIVHITVNGSSVVNFPQTISQISLDPATGNTSAIKTLFIKANYLFNLATDHEGNIGFIGYGWIGCSRANGAGAWRIEPGVYPTRLCSDRQGNLYVTGYFTKSVLPGKGRYIDSLELNPKSNENGVSYFAMKIKISTGEILWVKKIRTGDLSIIRGIYVDGSDNFFAYGSGRNYPDNRVRVLNFNAVTGEYKEAGSLDEGTYSLMVDQSNHLIGFRFVQTATESFIMMAKRGPVDAVMPSDDRVSIETGPNPFEFELGVYLNKIARGTYRIDLFDSSGKNVLSTHSDRVEMYLDLHWLQGGIYMLLLTESNGNQTVKKIVKRGA